MNFAEFELLEKTEVGQSGVQYRARHRMLGREVLLKTFNTEVPDPQGELRTRFEREIRLAGQLAHPNLVSTLHAGEFNGIPFIVLEHVDTMNGEQYAIKRGPLLELHVINIIIQAAQGLAYLHNLGIIHRNIKPTNLLIHSDGHVRIGNLTFARIDEFADESIADSLYLTVARQVIGTADYMAPEQAYSAKSADARSDVYSLGCTFYYLLTGQPPYPASDSEAKFTAHTQRPIPSLCDARLDVSDLTNKIFQKMIAKMSTDRYQSMDELIIELLEARKKLGFVPTKMDWGYLVMASVVSACTTALLVASMFRIGVVNYFFPGN